MKRSCYFISALSPAADQLAASLVLELRIFHPLVEALGVCGVAMEKAGTKSLCSMHHPGISGRAWRGPRARMLEKSLVDNISRMAPRVVILVGYHPFHNRLAAAFRVQGLKVVLFHPPVISGWHEKKVRELSKNFISLLGINPGLADEYREKGLDYTLVHPERVDQVNSLIVDRKTLGMEGNDALITFMPGSCRKVFRRNLPLFLKVAALLKKEESPARVLIPLSEYTGFDFVQSVLPSDHHLEEPAGLLGVRHCEAAGVFFVEGKSHEIMAVSRAALTCAGITTLESAVMGLPHVVIRPVGDKAWQGSLVNSLQEPDPRGQRNPAVPEFHTRSNPAEIADALVGLLRDGEARDNMLQSFRLLVDHIEDAGYPDAAEVIASHIGKRRRRSRSAAR